MPPVAGAFHEILTVVAFTEVKIRFPTAPGVPVVTATCETSPLPAALLALTLNVYAVAPLSPLIVAVVPETAAVPPPVTA